MREQIAQQPVATRTRRAPTPRQDEVELDDFDLIDYAPKTHTSTIDYRKHPMQTQVRMRYQTVIPERAHATQQTKKPIITTQPSLEEVKQPVPHRRPGFILLAVGAVLAIVVGAMLLNMIGAWWQASQDDSHYGRPRTFQCDALVNHGDSSQHLSHFIAINLNRQVQVIEWPGGDPTKVKVYLAFLLAPGHELDPATLEFRDVNGDGKPDMLVTVASTRMVFFNENGSFRPMHPDEHANV